MPELPDVEVFRDCVAKHALGRNIERVEVKSQRILESVTARSLAARLTGRTFLSTARRGKHLFVHTEDIGALVLHFGMTGFIQFLESDDERPKHTQAMFQFSDTTALAYSCIRLLGKISWTETADEYIRKLKLGPDALELGRNEFRDIMRQCKGVVKTSLMDQSRIAGLGNIYSDEILFQSGIHPSLPCKQLTERQVKKLYSTMLRVLGVAIRHNANPREFPVKYLIPHRREAARCPRCNENVRRDTVGGRSTYYCPNCQKKP